MGARHEGNSSLASLLRPVARAARAGAGAPSALFVAPAVTSVNPADGAAFTDAAAISLTAAAGDSGTAINSRTADISITNILPTVSITSPADGAGYAAPAAVTIAIMAADPDGAISKVEFFRDGDVLLGTDTASPYGFTWANVPVGTYLLTARATDNAGGAATSQEVRITVAVSRPPTVTITGPAPDTNYASPATITVEAAAGDPDGTVARVDFYAGSKLLGTSAAPPYSVTWQNVGPCSYYLTASATDNTGVVSTSAPVLVNVRGEGPPGETTPPNFKVAFTGDQGLTSNSVAVLNHIRSEGAQAVVVSGDLDYADNPAAWDAQLDGALGPDFPVFALIGNHDEAAWDGPGGYGERIEARFKRLGIPWCGRLGVQSAFHYKGIFFVFTSPGIDPGYDPGNNDLYIRDQLAADRSVWSVSAWHKNMHLMQAGGKSDETGWGVYEQSRLGGAVIATAHEHSYFRTHRMDNIINQTVSGTGGTLTLAPGHSFVFVSGLGGKSIRNQEVRGPWIARIYAAPCIAGDPVCTPATTYGTLFGVFNVDGQQNKAHFYFKDLNGAVIDSFTVISEVDWPTITSLAPAAVAAVGEETTLAVGGSGFISDSVVRINGQDRPTTYVSPTQLNAQLTAADTQAAGVLPVTVFNAVTGGGHSAAAPLNVNNPTPSLSSLSPNSVLAGGPAFTLTVTGMNFVTGAQVEFDGALYAATVSGGGTQAAASIPASEIASTGTYQVRVVNPPPGGGASGPLDFTVNGPNPAPTVASISPSVVVAGSMDTELTVNGANFVAGSVVRFNGSARTTTFVSSTQLTAALTAADIAAAGVATISVLNPAPGGGTSNGISLQIIAAGERITRLIGSGVPDCSGAVGVPVEVDALGIEHSISLSLSFDPAALGNPQATLGAGAAGATLTTDAGQAARGLFGLTLTLPPGQTFAAGTRQLAVIHFTPLARPSTGLMQVGFADEPTARAVRDLSGASLAVSYAAAVTIILPLEGDANGDGRVTISDWVKIGRYAGGLDSISDNCTFIRADVAPKSSLGSGTISIADWTQAGRYAAGLDPLQLAGGPGLPAGPVASPPLSPTSLSWAIKPRPRANERKPGRRAIAAAWSKYRLHVWGAALNTETQRHS